MSLRHDYWATHPYFRLEVENFIEEFCGWQPLQEMLEYTYDKRDKSFLAYLFETGSRVGEYPSLKKENFKLRLDQNLLLVKGMPNFKRYRKVSEALDENGNRHWVTERLLETRKTLHACRALTYYGHTKPAWEELPEVIIPLWAITRGSASSLSGEMFLSLAEEFTRVRTFIPNNHISIDVLMKKRENYYGYRT